MKTRLLTTIGITALALSMHSQTIVFSSNFANWAGNPSLPTDWMAAPATTIRSSVVTKDSTTNGLPLVKKRYVVNLNDTNQSKYLSFASIPFKVDSGMAYTVTYSYRGKGSVRAGLYTGFKNIAKDTALGFGTTYSGTESSNSGSKWYRVSQSILADTTTSMAQCILSVEKEATATKNIPPAITGIEIDSVVVTQWTPQIIDLYHVQYNTVSPYTSPFYGKMVKTGGIVTAVYSAGYYIQSTNATSWAGCEVYDYNFHPSMGDSITFTADVDEYFTNTELQTVFNYKKVSSNNPLPAPVLLNALVLNDATKNCAYQGILIKMDTVQTNPVVPFYGQWPLTDASVAASSSASVSIDKQIFSPTPAIVAYSKYSFIEGVGNFNFEFNIEPRFAADFGAIINVSVQNFNNTLVSKMYPNPVSNELTIDLSLNQEKATVTVYDMLGKEVSSPLITSGSRIILKNINLPSGVYMVKVLAGGQAQMMKFVKE